MLRIIHKILFKRHIFQFCLMLEKSQGVILYANLDTILLYQADWNFRKFVYESVNPKNVIEGQLWLGLLVQMVYDHCVRLMWETTVNLRNATSSSFVGFPTSCFFDTDRSKVFPLRTFPVRFEREPPTGNPQNIARTWNTRKKENTFYQATDQCSSLHSSQQN